MKKTIFKMLPVAMLVACGGEAEVEPQTASHDEPHEGSELARSDNSMSDDNSMDRDQSMDYVSTQNTQRTDKAMGKGSTTALYGGISDWDLDGNKELTLIEFERGLAKHKVYARWDLDESGDLNDLEYQTALFKAWDMNGDQHVDSYEFRDSASHWVGRDVTYGAFADWDLDGDVEISNEEFKRGVKKYHLFESYDADDNGEISDREYQTALFTAWDVDGDERIDAVEYRW